MKRLLLPLALLAGIAATGCDPAPSTPLAPDAKLPDTSKMTPEEIAKLREEGQKSDR